MIKLSDFKSRKRTELQGIKKIFGQKNARMLESIRAKMVTN